MISVIIPTFKNEELLVKNLQTNLRFLLQCEVVVVNDDPDVSLKDKLSKFKDIILIENKKNLGFAASINIGTKNARGDYLMFLNNDVVLTNDDFKKTANMFVEDKDLFAVSFAQKEKNGMLVGRNKFFWQKGLVFHSRDNQSEKGISAWAEGGSCLVDKKKFFEIGCFDEIYTPFYWEDIDLSFRAWKAGYKIIFTPEVIVLHQHETTIGKYFSKDIIKKIAFRNQFIFIWKNITDGSLIFQHFLLFIPNILFLLFKKESQVLAGLKEALSMIDIIRRKKEDQKKTFKLTDMSVFQFFL